MLQKGLTFDPSEQTSESSASEKKILEILASTTDSVEVVALRPLSTAPNTWTWPPNKFLEQAKKKIPPPPSFAWGSD